MVTPKLRAAGALVLLLLGDWLAQARPGLELAGVPVSAAALALVLLAVAAQAALCWWLVARVFIARAGWAWAPARPGAA